MSDTTDVSEVPQGRGASARHYDKPVLPAAKTAGFFYITKNVLTSFSGISTPLLGPGFSRRIHFALQDVLVFEEDTPRQVPGPLLRHGHCLAHTSGKLPQAFGRAFYANAVNLIQ